MMWRMIRHPERRLVPAVLLGVALFASGCSPSAPATPGATESESSESMPSESIAPVEVCPAPPADAPTGAVDDPFALGDPIVVECFTVTVDAVNKEATDAVVAANPSAQPAAGNVFMTVTVTITRSTGEPAEASDVEVVLGGSQTTDGQPAPDLRVDPPPPTGTLEEGQSVTGTYVYEMSGGASTSVEVSVGSMTPLNVLPY
jgi:hypothetical protein